MEIYTILLQKGGVAVYQLLIIGGGAAGLAAAVSAGRAGLKNIAVLEKNQRPARKLMITGKGRCNVTNNCDNAALIKNTLRNGRFMYSAFNAFSAADTMNFFEECGVALKTERGNRVFPQSDRSVSIVDALVKEASRYSKILHGRAIRAESVGGTFTVTCEDGTVCTARSLIIATGGISYPLTGSTGDGYALAEMLGHTIVPPSPSLTALVCKEGFCTELAGLSLKNVTLSLYTAGKKKAAFSELGEMLFTHTGISGPLVLTASAYMKEPRDYTVKIDLKPALSREQLDKRLLRDFAKLPNCDVRNALSSLLPKSLLPVVLRISGTDGHKKVNQISTAERTALITALKEFPLTVIGFAAAEEAIVTRGGVQVKEIDPSSMESKICDRLYFAGEVIDVDALTGGFNLQIAFSTGFLAGKSAAVLPKEEK